MNSTTNIVIPTYFPKPNFKAEAPYVAIVAVSPVIAGFWLKSYNHNNRPLNESNMSFLCDQAKRGQWIELNGDTISFDRDGNLNNGQHRLNMVVRTGLTIKFMVVVGVPKESFKVMDTGRGRGGADVLAIEGFKNYALISSMCRFLINWNSKKWNQSAKGSQKSNYITNTDILNFAKDHQQVLEAVSTQVLKYYYMGDKLIRVSLLASFAYLFGLKNAVASDNFIYKLSTGADIGIESPIFLLRKKLKEYKNSDKKNLPTNVELAFIVKTWNAYISKSKLKRLTYNPSIGEKFPKII